MRATKEERLEYQRLYYLAFPEKRRAATGRFYKSEKGRLAILRASHAPARKRYLRSPARRAAARKYAGSDKGLAVRRAYRKTDTGRAQSRRDKTRRRAAERHALVLGCGKEIAKLYTRASWLRSQGWDVEVDHIFPLGFGWHEPANLQIIFAEENRVKNCSFDFTPSMVFV